MAYLRCRLRGSSPYRHLKLVLIGANGTGKTTLFSQLVRLKSHPLTMSSPSTKSHMELATFEFRGETRSGAKGGGKGRKEKGGVEKYRPKIMFHLIDFTSEEVFQSIHQCFLTHRTLFLCMWDTTKGVESLQSLAPWLRSIQASAPGSSVLIIGSHMDQRPGLSRATIAEWEKEVFGDAVRLNEHDAYHRNCGFPIVSDSVALNCQNKRDVERLMENIYHYALRLKHPKTHVLLMEEMVPRSYQELQTLVEVKQKVFQRKGQLVPVLRREEFIDHVRSLTLHHDSLEQDEEEFSLAVRFLHEAGTIVHYKSQVVGMSELFFLSPQWLFNTLGVVMAQMKARSQDALISSTDLPLVFQSANIPAHFFRNFLSMLEENDVIVSLDMEKNRFLIPSVLESTAPSHYPAYNLVEDPHTYLMQYVHFDYIPSGLFPRLLARVLICLQMLSGQLLALQKSPLTKSDERNSVAGLDSVVKLSGAIHHRYRLDRMGYVREDDIAEGTATEKRLRDKIWALSTTNLSTWPNRHRSLTEKLVTLSRPILEQKERVRGASISEEKRGEEGEEEGGREGERGRGRDGGEGMEEGGTTLVNGEREEDEEEETTGQNTVEESRDNTLNLFSENVVWKKGIHVKFPCGTRFWLESCEGALAMIIQGEVVQRVKVVTFLTACVDMLMDEYYAGVRVMYYSPCPSCLTRYWSQQNNSATSLTDNFLKPPTFAESDLELSGEVSSLTLNEFTETASFVRQSSSDHGSLRKSFSGASLKLEHSPSPTTEEHTVVKDMPYAILDDGLTLYSLTSLVMQSTTSSAVRCSKCEAPVALREIAPHVLLVDFSDKLLISSRRLRYDEREESLLGEGGFGKVRDTVVW